MPSQQAPPADRRIEVDEWIRGEYTESNFDINVEMWETEYLDQDNLVGITTIIYVAGTNTLVSSHTVSAPDWEQLEQLRA